MTGRLTARLVVPSFVVIGVLVGCGGSSADEPSETLTVFAAASLRDVFGQLEPAWETERAGSDLVVAFDGSNVLAAQISEGAPADVFASADLARPQSLLDSGDASGALVPFASNRVALAVPADDARVQAPADLAEPGVKLVAAGSGVPITGYADTALERLADDTADPQAFSDAVRANVVSREDNVRAALAKVELGEGDAAFVYGTDILSSDDAAEVAIGVDVIAEYGAVRTSDHTDAQAFLEWLTGAEAGAILADAGFGPAAP